MKGRRLLVSLLVTVALVLGLTLPAAAQVDPPTVEADIGPGKSITIEEKEVTVPALLPVADVVISMDLTGSMGGELTNLKLEIDSMIDALSEESADLNVGIVSHEDYPDEYDYCGYDEIYGDAASGDEAFRVDYAVGDDFDAASQAVQDMTLKWGVDGPESYARVMWESGQSDSGIGYRAGAQKILVMFLDNIPHDCGYDPTTGVDPGRDEDAGTGDDIDVQDDAIPAMTDDDITLLVVYSGWAGTKSVWDDIAEETGGSAVQINSNGTVPGGMSLTDLILELISELTTDVWWEVEADDGLTVELDPVVYSDVEGETTVTFTETITVDKDVEPCNTLTATVTFYANSYPEEGVPIGEQEILIHVIDDIPPEVSCVPAENPHGKNEPGGKAKGKSMGSNPDGFYELIATDIGYPDDSEPEIWVGTACGTLLFGPFHSGDIVKITEDPGAVPSCKKMGSSKGQAGAVISHIILPSDAVIWAVDASGNTSLCATCLVPPPPK